MKRITRIAAGAAAAVALAAAGLSFAHPGAGYGYGMGPGMGPGMAHAMGPGMGPGMQGGWGMGGMGWGPQAESLVDSRLAALKADLKITAGQESAWSAFESQAKEQAASMRAMHEQRRGQMLGGSAFDPTAWHAAMSRLFEARGTAMKNLYDVLTPEQRATADRGLSPTGLPCGTYGARARY